MFCQAIIDKQLQNTAEKTVCHLDSILIHQFFFNHHYVYSNKIK